MSANRERHVVSRFCSEGEGRPGQAATDRLRISLSRPMNCGRGTMQRVRYVSKKGSQTLP